MHTHMRRMNECVYSYACTHVCMYVSTYVFMYVCVYVLRFKTEF